MKLRDLGSWASILAWTGMLAVPTGSRAQEPLSHIDASTRLNAQLEGTTPPKKEVAVDVSLDHRGVLHGSILDLDGEPVSMETVELWRHGERAGVGRADGVGQFQMALQRGGVYQLRTSNKATTVRIWTSKSAPPNCARQLVVVSADKPIVRGQSGTIPYTRLNPWVVTGVAAVAIAIPVALHNKRSDRSNGS